MSLPHQQNLEIISLLPKGAKPKMFLKNWRPITLLNSTYKLISSCIAARISKFLPKLINSDQSGFLNGRYIGDSLRLTYDVIDWAKNNNKAGLLLAIDFEKAFDSVSSAFIIKTLKFFNFGANICRWVKLLLNNFQAVIHHAGNISRRFDLLRGCRQGDPIASLLFILSIEILAIRLRGDKNIKGFRAGQIEILLSL